MNQSVLGAGVQPGVGGTPLNLWELRVGPSGWCLKWVLRTPHEPTKLDQGVFSKLHRVTSQNLS